MILMMFATLLYLALQPYWSRHGNPNGHDFATLLVVAMHLALLHAFAASWLISGT